MPRSSDPVLQGLVDDAALFPPGNAPMEVALRQHDHYGDQPWAEAVGPFLCPASRVEEMLAARAPLQSLRVSVVFDVSGDLAHAALRAIAAEPRVVLVGVEASLATLGEDALAVGANLARRPAAVGYLEVPRTGFDEALDLVAASGWHAAKYRTGGVTADAFPSEAELAAFLVACVRRGQRFKLTAGLHHAVRHTTGDGHEQHGVLNVLVAVRVARTGDGDVEKVLADRDSEALGREVRSWTRGDGAAVRRLFLSFGCCGVTDPLDELRALGVVDDPEQDWA